MSDAFMTLIAIMIAAVLILFPLMSMADRTDDISEITVQTATTEFVDKVKTTGKITVDSYNEFASTLATTGNTYDIEMQIQHLDENPGVKVTQADVTKIGENLYYNEYTSQIEERLHNDKRIALKEGDIFSVTVKNTNKTIAEMLRGFFYSISGDDTYQISGRHAGTVSVNGASK
ncbi:MAG: hypothetical protein HFJ29_05660 [Clostridia bacterium]|nr:hypothetical protein [Clostridia bacterium]